MDLNLSLGFPADDFGDQTDAVGVGGSANILFPIAATNNAIQIGFGGGYMEYGNNRTDEIIELEITQGSNVIDRITIPMEIRTSNNILHGQAMVRFEAPFPMFKPYAEGVAGFRRLSTDTRVFDRSREGFFIDNDNDNDLITSVNNLSDWIFNFGAGGGLNIEFPSGFGIHAGVSYLLGGEAEFFDASDTEQWDITFNGTGGFDPDNINGEDIVVEATPREAKIDLIFVEIGLRLNFGRIAEFNQQTQDFQNN